MKQAALALLAVLMIAILLVVSGSFYVVNETDQVIITEFGKPKGEPIAEAGLNFKMPFIQDVNRIEKRILEWDGQPNEMPTKDKLYILVDTFGRWQITDSRRYFERLRDERSARSRLDDILGSETRNAVAKHNLIEIIRTTKDREVSETSEIIGLEGIVDGATVTQLEPISKGRSVIEKEIFENARGKLAEVGVDLLDIRFKRINYNQQVRERIYDRMISERQQIAELYRSQGASEAAKILGNKELELKKIESEAYKKEQLIRGEGDAKATEIYAAAYNQSPDSADFYQFLKTMETYSESLGSDTTVVLSTDSDFFKFLNRMEDKQKQRPSGGGSALPFP